MKNASVSSRLSADLPTTSWGVIPFDLVTSKGGALGGRFTEGGNRTIAFGVRMLGEFPVRATIYKNGEPWRTVVTEEADFISGSTVDTEGERNDFYGLGISSSQPLPPGGAVISFEPLSTYFDVIG